MANSTLTSKSSSASRRWTKSISTMAARIFFVLIIFQIPLFRVTCRSGAAVNGLIHNLTLPKWDDLLDLYNLTNAKEASAVTDLQRLEVLAGSYFTVAGALVGLVKPGRMSMFGTLLVIWGLVKEGILGKPVTTDPSKSVYVYPTMVIAMICAL